MIKKLDARSSRYIFVGYDSGTHGYRLYDPVTRRISVRRDVAFDESRTGASLLLQHTPTDHQAYVSLFPILSEGPPHEQEAGCCPDRDAASDEHDQSQTDSDSDTNELNDDSESEKATCSSRSSADSATPSSFPTTGDDGCPSPTADPPAPSARAASFSPTAYRHRSVHEDSLTLPINNEANLLHLSEPRTVQEALSGSHASEWLSAITSELMSMDSHEVYDLVEPPYGAHVIGSHWVFKVKLHSDGSIDKFKARLVALGNRQKYGIDFGEVFAPGIGHDTVRCLLSLAASLNLEVHHVDIKTAFLNGQLHETVYMRQPPGFIKSGNENHVWRLKKSIYGLRQSPKMWNDTLHDYLIQPGFQRSICDFGVYVRRHSSVSSDIKIVGVFVDDMLLFAPTVVRLRTSRLCCLHNVLSPT
jgi:hypothetical protein